MTIGASTMSALFATDGRTALASMEKAEASLTTSDPDDRRRIGRNGFSKLQAEERRAAEKATRKARQDRELWHAAQKKIHAMRQALRRLEAVSVIMNKWTLTMVQGGRLDDTLLVTGRMIWEVAGGPGGDRIVASGDYVHHVDGEEGDDAISVGGKLVGAVAGGAGRDAVTVHGKRFAAGADGGDGADAIAVDAPAVRGVYGGKGNDAMAVSASYVETVDGGDGADGIAIAAHDVMRVYGGAGDDAISIKAIEISMIRGGAGNDAMTIDAEKARLYFAKGDGNDLIRLGDGARAEVVIDKDLAGSIDDVAFAKDAAGNIHVRFRSGESMVFADADRADSIVLSFRGGLDLRLPEPDPELSVHRLELLGDAVHERTGRPGPTPPHARLLFDTLA
jgi:hypothetical protein